MAALSAVYHESRVHVPRGMRYVFLKTKRTTVQIAWVQTAVSLRTRVRAPAIVCYWSPFFFFPLVFFKLIFIAQVWFNVYCMCLVGTAQLSPQLCLPCSGTYLRYNIIQLGPLCRLTRVHVPCAVRDIYSKKNIPRCPNMACVQLFWICRREFEPR